MFKTKLWKTRKKKGFICGYSFNPKKYKEWREDIGLGNNTITSEFYIRGQKVELRTLYRWEQVENLGEPKASQFMVLIDIARQVDPNFKIDSFFDVSEKKNNI